MERDNHLTTNQLIAGDCVEVLARFPRNCIDLTVTSPPYDKLRNYEGYSFDAKGVASALFLVTKPGGVVFGSLATTSTGGGQ